MFFFFRRSERQRKVSISRNTIWDRDKSMGDEGIVFWFFREVISMDGRPGSMRRALRGPRT